MILEFETLQMVQSLLQISIGIGKNLSTDGNIDLSYSCCQQHQFQYLLKKSIWKSNPRVCSWPFQILNHVFIWLITLLKVLDTYFHVIQRKYVLIEKQIPSVILVTRVRQGEDTPRTIFYHVFIALILVGFDRYCWIYFSKSSVKLCRAWKLGESTLCSYHLIGGLWTELTVMDGSLPVFGFIIIQVPWKTHSLEFLEQVKQCILEYGYVPDQITIYLSSSLYNTSHSGPSNLNSGPSTTYDHFKKPW